MLQLHAISKSFPGVQALNAVDLQVERGVCHGLVGENGAGKSTLGKIIAGIYQPDSGEFKYEGKEVHFRDPLAAANHGIHMVHQELLFCENLTVAENLCLENLPTKAGFLDQAEMHKRAKAALEQIGADIKPDTIVGDLSVSRQQLVQIAGAIGKGAKVIVFDEPTSSLSSTETERLFKLIKELKQSGVICIYVSHRLEEIFAICDAVTVLRDGRLVETQPVGALTQERLVSLMIGRELSLANTTTPPHQPKDLLDVNDLSRSGRFENISLTVKAGEIVGLAGLVGAGRTEIAEAIFGLDHETTGTVSLEGTDLRSRSPQKSRDAGIGLVPEDRKRHGLVLSLTARQNITLTVLKSISSLGFIREREEKKTAGEFFNRLQVRAPSVDAPTAGLSGGNQQKLVLAKWLAADCKVLLVDEPTRGVDVGAKAEIYEILRKLAEAGKGILVISSELPELLALTTRILVVRSGRIVAELTTKEATEELLMRHMALEWRHN